MAVIIDVATQEDNEGSASANLAIDQIENVWIRTLLTKCVTLPKYPHNEDLGIKASVPYEVGEPDIRFAQNVLLALLQSGSISSLNAAGALLRHRWLGQRRLSSFFYDRLELLDNDTQVLWRDRLNPLPEGNNG